MIRLSVFLGLAALCAQAQPRSPAAELPVIVNGTPGVQADDAAPAKVPLPVIVNQPHCAKSGQVPAGASRPAVHRRGNSRRRGTGALQRLLFRSLRRTRIRESICRRLRLRVLAA